MGLPPEWPFRCPGEGWYLSNVEAEFGDLGSFPVRVTGDCKRHGRVTVTDSRAYAPYLWSTVEEQ